MHIFEAIMLVCFGFSWPVAILKTWQAKNPAGKSVLFAYIIELGYLAGIVNKFLNGLNWVVWLYVVNMLMVGIDLVLVIYYRNKLKKVANND